MHDLDSAATPALADGGNTSLESVGSQNNDVEVNMIIKEFEAQALLQVQNMHCIVWSCAAPACSEESCIVLYGAALRLRVQRSECVHMLTSSPHLASKGGSIGKHPEIETHLVKRSRARH